MNCPICKTEMNKGYLGSENESWIPEESALAFLNWLSQSPTFGKPRLIAYRCKHCGKVELTTEKFEQEKEL